MFTPRTSQSAHASRSKSDTFFKPRVQTKLAIGTPGDRYEVEADRTADKVVAGIGEKSPEPFFSPKPAMKNDAAVQQSPDTAAEKETQEVQEKPIAESVTPLQASLLEEPKAEPAVQEKPLAESVTPLQASLLEEPKADAEAPMQLKAETDTATHDSGKPAAEIQTSPQPFLARPVLQQQQETSGGDEEVQEEEVQEKAEEEPEKEVQMAAAEEESVQLSAEADIMEQFSDLKEPVQKSAETTPAAEPVQLHAAPMPVVQHSEAPAAKEESAEEEIQEKSVEELQTSLLQASSDDENTDAVQTSEGSQPADISSRLSSSKGGGSPMSEETQSEMGSGFGADFSNVRVHTDDNAVQMNRDLGAQAFANGSDIYFNSGKYDPDSTGGKHLLAHELTHTIQQGASPKSDTVQKAPQAAPAAPGKPVAPLDITHRLELTDDWAKYLDAEYAAGKRKIAVDVKIGDRYSGVIELNKKRGTASGETAKYGLAKGSTAHYLDINGWEFFDPLRNNGMYPILVLNDFADDGTTTGFLSIRKGETPFLANVHEFLKGFNTMLDKMRFIGLEPLKVVDGFENKFETGRLIYQISALKTVIDGYLEAGGGFGITGDAFTFNANAKVSVPGLAEGELMIARGEDGTLSGSIDINADIANINATLHAEYIDGVVTIQGTGRISSDKFDGEVTLLVTDAKRSQQMMHAALGVESMDEANENAPTEAVAKTKNNQVLAAWGEVTANITPWLAGTAKIGIDDEGHVTIVGEISVPNEVELMEQRGKKVDIFKVEIRAGYGIPLLGQVFLFASIGMFMNAGFGPLVLKNVAFTGTYSTDPDVLQNFSVTGTLGINAFAVLGLEAEAGVGLTLLGHDLKAGVNVTAAAGLRAYAEATPTLEYKEEKAPEGGKVGETHLKGHFEAAAQLFLQLSGALFTEIDSPWWSPVPDGREEFPLGEVQYPIGDSLGIGADMDWIVGSPDIPEVTFSPVEFDPDKFTADVMADPPPGKKGDAKAEPDGEWTDGNAPGDQTDPPQTHDGPGLPENQKKKEDLKKLPDEEKYMRALDEMSKFEHANPKATIAVVNARAKKVKQKYDLEKITVEDNDETAEIYVKHKDQNNGDHILEVPLMSEAERAKLLSAAMDDLKKRETAVADPKDNTMEEEKAKDLVKDWAKANPVVEEAHVKDGGETWDYFIDIGDKSHTEKGKRKKDTMDGEVPKAGDGELGKIVKFTEGEEKHTLWINFVAGKGVLTVASTPEAVADKLTEWEGKLKGPEWAKRKKLKPTVEGLIAQVRAKLHTIDGEIAEATTPSETISENSVNQVDSQIEQNEDTMADLLKQLFGHFDEKYDFSIVFAEKLMFVHATAKETVDASLDEISATMTDRKEIQSWSKLVEWLKIADDTNKLFDNPIHNGLAFGVYVTEQIDRIGEEELKEKYTVKKEKLVGLITLGTHAFSALTKQILDYRLEPDANDKIRQVFISEKLHNKFKPFNIQGKILENGNKEITYNYAEGDQKFTTIIDADEYPIEMKGESLMLHVYGRGYTDDPPGKVPNQGQDSSHGIANELMGTGYNAEVEMVVNGSMQKIKVNLNLLAASSDFNKKTMRNIEIDIVKYIEAAGADTFNMTVNAEYAKQNLVLEDEHLLKIIAKMHDEVAKEKFSAMDLQALKVEIMQKLPNVIQPRILDVKYSVTLQKSGKALPIKPFKANTGPDMEYGK